MDQKYRTKIVIVTLIAGIMAAVLIVFFIGNGTTGGDGGSDSNNFITFLPIWIAIFVPVFVATQQRNREKAKRQFRTEDEDIYSMMNRLVDELDNDEMDYLKRRLQRKFGDTLSDQSR